MCMRIATLMHTPLSGWPDSVDVRAASSLSALASMMDWCDAALVDPQAAGGAWLRRARRFAGAVPVVAAESGQSIEEMVDRLQEAIDVDRPAAPETRLIVSAAPWEALEVRHPDALWICVTRPAPANAIDATGVPFQPTPRCVSPMQLEHLVMRTVDAAKEDGVGMVVLDDLYALEAVHPTADLIRFINYLSHCLAGCGAGLEIGIRPASVVHFKGHIHGEILAVDGPVPVMGPLHDDLASEPVPAADLEDDVSLVPR